MAQARLFDKFLGGGVGIKAPAVPQVEGGFERGPGLFDKYLPEPVVQSRDAAFIQSVPRGVAGVIGGILQDISLMSAEVAQKRLDTFKQMDETGRMPELAPGRLPESIYELYLQADETEREQLQEGLRAKLVPTEGIFHRAGTALERKVAALTYVDITNADSLAVAFGHGAGSLLTFMATGVAGRVMKLGMAPTFMAGAMVGGDSLFQDAIRSGASLEDAYTSAGWGRIAGMSEALPIMRMFDRFDKDGSLRALLLKPLAGGVEEGAQELFQGMVRNLTANTFVKYDEERGVFEGTLRDVEVGFGLGALANFAVMVVGGTRRAGQRGPGPSLEDALAENPEAFGMAGEATAQFVGVQPGQQGVNEAIAAIDERSAALAVEEGAEPLPIPLPAEAVETAVPPVEAPISPIETPADPVSVGAPVPEGPATIEPGLYTDTRTGDIIKVTTPEEGAVIITDKDGMQFGVVSPGGGVGPGAQRFFDGLKSGEYVSRTPEGAAPVVEVAPEIPTPLAEPTVLGGAAAVETAPIDEGAERHNKQQQEWTEFFNEATGGTIADGRYTDTRTGLQYEVLNSVNPRTGESSLTIERLDGSGAIVGGISGAGQIDGGTVAFASWLKDGFIVAEQAAAPIVDATPTVPPIETAAPPVDPANVGAPVPFEEATPEVRDPLDLQTAKIDGYLEDPQVRTALRRLTNKGGNAADVAKAIRQVAISFRRIGDNVIKQGGNLEGADAAQRAFLESLPADYRAFIFESIDKLNGRIDDIASYEAMGATRKQAEDIVKEGLRQKRPVTKAPTPEIEAPIEATAPSTTPELTPVSDQAYQVFTPEGTATYVEDVVVPLSSLITSHTADFTVNPAFPQELQPRDRTRADSALQVTEIAGNLQPERLGPGPEAGTGAPITGQDGVVESGNARVMALRQVYAQNGEAGYVQYLKDQGHNVDGIDQPILVRRRVDHMSPAERVKFTAEANRSAVASSSLTEVAVADAKALPDHVMDLYNGGDLLSAANRNFITKFVETVIAPTERGAILTANGELSKAGRTRIESAMFQRAYGDPEFLAVLRESTSPVLKSIGEALIDVAPLWAQMRAAAASGEIIQEMDATAPLTEAIAAIRRAQQEGVPVMDVVNQTDFLKGEISDTGMEILGIFYREDNFTRQRGRPAIVEHLTRYTEEAGKALNQPSLIPGESPLTADEIFRKIRHLIEREKTGLLSQRERTTAPGVRAYGFKNGPLPTVGTTTGDAFWDGYQTGPKALKGKAAVEREAYKAGVTRRKEKGLLPKRWLGQTDQRKGRKQHDGDLRSFRRGRGGGEHQGGPGVNYRGQIKTMPTDEPKGSRAPIQRSSILTDLAKALNTTLYQGHMGGRATPGQPERFGFFRINTREVRYKYVDDIETAAHEVAHLLDDRDPQIAEQWRGRGASQVIVEELRGLSYNDTMLYEGFAEFHRHWMTNRAVSEKFAPEFTKWWENYVKKQPWGKDLLRAREQMHKYFEQGSLTRAGGKIGLTASLDQTLTTWGDMGRQLFVDDLNGLRVAEYSIHGEILHAGAYETARTLRGTMAVIEGTFKLGHIVMRPDGSIDFEGKGLRQIIKPVKRNLDEFLKYLVGLSSDELYKQGREHLFSRDEIDAMLELGKGNKKFEKAAREYLEWQEAGVDFAVANGVIDPAHRANWRRNFYVSFKRVATAQARTGKIPGEFSPIRALTGGTENLRDIMLNIEENMAMLVGNALKNRAMQHARDMTRGPEGGAWMSKVPTKQVPARIDKAQVARMFWDHMGVSQQTLREEGPPEGSEMFAEVLDDMSPFLEFWIRNQRPDGDNIVAVMDGGKTSYYQVNDPVLLRTFMNFSRPAPSAGLGPRLLRFGKRAVQTTVTVALSYTSVNFWRDQWTAGVFSQTGYRPFIDAIRGMGHIMLKSDTYKKYIANGAGLSSFIVDEESVRRKVTGGYKRRAALDPRKVIDRLDQFMTFAEGVTAAIETSTRMGEFARSIRLGDHPTHAAYLAREISTDFGMRGGSMPEGGHKHGGWDKAANTMSSIYDMVMFMKAQTNGVDRAYRAYGRDKGYRAQAIERTVLLGFFGTALHFLNRELPEYDEITEDQKWLYYHFPMINLDPAPGEDRVTFFKMSRPFEPGMIGAVMEETVALGLGDQDLNQYFNDLVGILMGVVIMPIPTLVKPPLEVALNVSTYTWNAVVNRTLENQSPWMQHTPSTNRGLTRLGEKLAGTWAGKHYSPVKAEHMLRGYGNAWASWAMMLMDRTVLDEQVPALTIQSLPVVRRFYRNRPPSGTRHMTDLWEAIGRLEEERANLSQAIRDTTDMDDITDISEVEMIADIIDGMPAKFLDDANAVLSEFRRAAAYVYETDNLKDLQGMADTRSRVLIDGHPSRLLSLVKRLKDSGIYDDLPRIKRFLLDDLTLQRNDVVRQWRAAIGEFDTLPRDLLIGVE